MEQTGSLAIPVIWKFFTVLCGDRSKQKRVYAKFCMLNVKRWKHQKTLGKETLGGKEKMTLH